MNNSISPLIIISGEEVIFLNIKLGDIVVRKGDNSEFLFQVTGFDGDYAVLKGMGIPIITICRITELIKLNRQRSQFTSLKIVK
ncbi:MAG: hypothetical protein ACOCQW_03070 [Halanaerobiaceae bacterium]